MNFTVEIAQDNRHWSEVKKINERLFVEILDRILMRYPNFAKVAELELSVLLTDDSKMKSLNKEFRGNDKATNVLSFPDLKINWRKIVEFPVNMNYMYLGDIAFCYQVILEESNKNSICFLDHFKHLAVHAILHLIGYDHIEESDALEMESIEIEILKSFNIASPY